MRKPRPREAVPGLRSCSTLAEPGLDYSQEAHGPVFFAPRAGEIPLLSMLPPSMGTPQSVDLRLHASHSLGLWYRHLECCPTTPPPLTWLNPSVFRSHLKGHLLREPGSDCTPSNGAPAPPLVFLYFFKIIHSFAYFFV